MSRAKFLVYMMSMLIAAPAVADVVVPSERVINGVAIREAPSGDSSLIGSLSPGEYLEWIRNTGRWREIRLSPTQTGLVVKSFTRRVPDIPAPPDPPLAPRKENELRVRFLPVGSGSCAVVECPGANAPPMIVDCGSPGPESRGPGDLNNAAAAAMIDSILANHDAPVNVVVSHAHRDHYNYLDRILDSQEVGKIWLGGDSTKYNPNFAKLVDGLDDGSGNIHRDLPVDFHNDQKELGEDLHCGDASTYILTANTGSTRNAHSLVLAIEYGDFSVTFAGDAEATTERQAIENFDEAVKTTVLTGSHHGHDAHGSNGSAKGVGKENRSGWPQATLPEVMVYNHGRGGGNPRCTSVRNYHGSLARVPNHPFHCGQNRTDNTPAPRQTGFAEYSTEVNGTITITTDGTSPLSVHCGGEVGCATTIEF